MDDDGRLSRMAGSAKMDWVPKVGVPQASPILRDLGISLPEALEALALSTLVAGTVFLIQWRYGFNWSDEGWLWYISQRTAHGQVPIRDVFSYDPGRYYWSALVFKILHGNGLFEQIVANYLFGLLGLTAAYLAMARGGMSRGWRISSLLLLGVMLGFPRHKTFEQSLSLVAVAGIAFVMAKPAESKRWFLYGIATGLAAFMGKNSGVYFAAAGLILLILLKLSTSEVPTGRALFAGLLGIVVGYSPMLFMLCAIRGFASAFYQSVVLAPTWQLTLPIPFPWHVHLKGLHGMDLMQARAVSILCLVIPLAYFFLILGWLKFREDRGTAAQLACAASVAGLPYLHHAFSRADFFHIAQGILPFVIVSSAVTQHFWLAQKRWLSVSVFGGVAALVVAAWVPYEPAILFMRMQARDPLSIQQIEIHGKGFYVPIEQAQVMLAAHTAFRNCSGSDGSFLAAPYYPGLYAFLNTRAPFWDTYHLWPRSNDLQMKHIQALVQNRTSLVLINRDASFDNLARLRLAGTYPKLVDYILKHYQRVNTILPEGFELYSLPQNCRGPA